MVAAICGRYKPLLYSVCNAYLRKLSDKFKCWLFFFTIFRNIHSVVCFHKLCTNCMCAGASVVGSVRCVTDDMFQIYENHVDQSVATKKSNSHSFCCAFIEKKNTEYTCKTIF